MTEPNLNFDTPRRVVWTTFADAMKALPATSDTDFNNRYYDAVEAQAAELFATYPDAVRLSTGGAQ